MTTSACPATPESLLDRFRRTRDPEALGELFDRTAPELFRIALSLAPDAAAAEDALQETFLALFEAASRHEAGRAVVPWLVGILKVKVHEARRRVRRTPDRRRLALPEDGDGVEGAARRRERTEPVRRALEALPEPYRAVALLRWRYGLSPAEIAHVRDEPPGTVWSLLSRALARHRKGLGRLACAVLGAPHPPGRGAVKQSVLAKTALATGGTVMARKGLVAAALLLLVAGGGYAVLRGAGQDRGEVPAPDPARADGRRAGEDAAGRPALAASPDAVHREAGSRDAR